VCGQFAEAWQRTDGVEVIIEDRDFHLEHVPPDGAGVTLWLC
jgi:hypothetical protein